METVLGRVVSTKVQHNTAITFRNPMMMGLIKYDDAVNMKLREYDC